MWLSSPWFYIQQSPQTVLTGALILNRPSLQTNSPIRHFLKLDTTVVGMPDMQRGIHLDYTIATDVARMCW